jgi:putative ABC transport system permease protein
VRGTLRWVRTDLRAHRAQSAMTVAVIAGVVAALVLAVMLLEGALNPWQQLFNRTKGADALVYLAGGTSAANLRALPGVTEVAAPYEAADATLVQGQRESHVQVDGMTPSLPAMSAPLVVAGTWLRAGQLNGVVIEASFAAADGVGLGSEIVLHGVDGTTVLVSIIGIADTADQGFYPQWTPGLIWAQQGLLAEVEPAQSETTEVVGLRLADPSAAGTAFTQDVFDAYNPIVNSPVERVTTSQQVMDSMASDDRLLGELLALFGIIALTAAPCAIANVTSGRVLMQRQDLAMLKALGFTPGQVVRMLLAEQLALGLAGTALGLVTAEIATSPVFVRPAAGIGVTLAPLPGTQSALVAAGAILTVLIATAIPAWRAGRVSPVAAVQPSPPRGHLSRVARLSLLFRLPAALVLGVRDALTRRLPAALTVAGVAIPLAMITIALAVWSTIGAFTADPGRIGLAGALTVYTGGPVSDAQAARLIAADPQVSASYPGAQFDTPLPGDNGTFIARAMGTSQSPYPFQVVQGRMFRAEGEAVAGQGFLDLMHIKVGQRVDLTINGEPVILDVVGRTIEPDNGGDVIDFGLDSLPTSALAFYSLVLKPGVSAEAARAELLRASGNRLDVRVAANPADRLGVVRVVIVVAIVILVLIAMANLLTATDVGLRDHAHEAGILKAMGLTPRQVMATLVVSTTIVTAIGIVAGVAAGLAVAPRLINAQGQGSGMGWGLAAGLSPASIACLLAAALAAAVTAALFLSARAAHAQDPLLAVRTPAPRRSTLSKSVLPAPLGRHPAVPTAGHGLRPPPACRSPRTGRAPPASALARPRCPGCAGLRLRVPAVPALPGRDRRLPGSA